MRVHLLSCVGLVTALLCTIPLMLPSRPYSDSDRVSLTQSINTPILSNSLLMSVTTCLVLSFDGFLDYLFGSFQNKSLERWLFLSSLLFPNLILFLVLAFADRLSPGPSLPLSSRLMSSSNFSLFSW